MNVKQICASGGERNRSTETSLSERAHWMHRSKSTFKSALAASVASGVLLISAPSFGAMDKPLLVVSGDFDGDGQFEGVQGFPEASDGAGRVDVFWGDPNFKVAWPTVLSAIKDPTTRLASGRLGESLAVGDFNGDGLDDLAIGAPYTNSPLLVADISLETSVVGPSARVAIVPHSGSVVVIYGCSAAACGAVDSDGAGLPAVGSALDPSSGAGALQITPSPSVDFGRFGKSMAAGDFDDDGYDDLAIGAPGDTVDTKLEAGSVTIIYGSSTGLDLSTRQLIHQNHLPAGASPAEADDHFGVALSAARLDTDDKDDLVVGVPDEDYGVEVNPGEVDVFWGGADGLSASSYVRFRHTSAMAGAGVGGDRLGNDVRAYNSISFLSGTLFLGLAEAAICGGGKGFLAVPAGGLGIANPAAVLNCDADICDAASTPGDGALPEIPVNFIVIGNVDTVPSGALALLPTASWTGTDPITGGAISGAEYFESMVDLLNQQLRADDASPVCDDTDCLRFAYRSHTYYSPSMFTSGVCPKLHAIAEPAQDLAITENCKTTIEDSNNNEIITNNCPIESGQTRYDGFSNFANAAVDECTLLTDDDALNVIIYDVCERDAGADGVVNTSDDDQDCVGARNGRARPNGNHPYMFLDYARALQPRTPATTVAAAEEHEAGHAFGLNHACEPRGHGGNTRTMQTGDCVEGLGVRNLGFDTHGREDVDGNFVIEVGKMIETAREHIQEWQCP
jgi:hypothetical protein